ncbi:MAG: hypothetical protein IKE01_04935 [Clostridia bacterium]|nr:hypothetical protein [Clostridia bacterium]
MEEKSLRVYDTEKTFFSKIGNKLNKWLTPGRLGINNVLITLKRNNMLKCYENYIQNEKNNDRKGVYLKKYEEAYSLYLDSIDKNIIEAIYKKVKNNTATEFEKNALSKYYNIIHIKDLDYTEYKNKKQKFLLEIDYETVQAGGKSKVITRFNNFYYDKMETLYKNLVKQYSVKLLEDNTENEKNDIYNKIYTILDEYITKMLPYKMEQDPTKELFVEIKDEYEETKSIKVNKLDQNDVIEKNMLLLGLSRRLFTHSLPLGVAEQCYNKLLDDLRNLIVDTRISKKKDRAYTLLLRFIEEFNLKVLSTKVYWDNAEERNSYREFWKKYQEIENIEDTKECVKQKEILFIQNELKETLKNENKYSKIIAFYKSKLVELGVMKKLPNKCATLNKDSVYVQDLIEVKKNKAKAKVKKSNG